ncbi:hypothetical protein [Nevskia soli]|uniref:hypothetical protein n=1 Tax=Nevskia soli TaxID=418856 RepID=UPI0015D8EFE7|nr:hypothetical protein [Nevskia soli]
MQQWSTAPHFAQLFKKSVPGGNMVEQLKHRDPVTFCTSRGNLGPVTSIGGRGPCGLERSPWPLWPCRRSLS